jgi:putative membrane protein
VIAHGNGAEHVAIAASAILLIAVYAALWSRQRAPAPHRVGFWTFGVVTLVAASTPWMESLAGETFTGHMVQHLLVIALAAPLLVLAQPMRTAVRSGMIPPTAAGRRLGAAWRRYAPLVGPVVFVVVLFVTHLTSVYDRALGNRLIHELEHAAYLGSSVLLWSAVMGPGRVAAVARVGVAFGVGAAGSVLGMAVLSASEPLIPTYARQIGFDDALADQRTAATIMWIGGMVTTVPLLLVAVWRWASAEERTTRHVETLAAHPHVVPPRSTDVATTSLLSGGQPPRADRRGAATAPAPDRENGCETSNGDSPQPRSQPPDGVPQHR